jgi:20S proteasome alpha/beta subunit
MTVVVGFHCSDGVVIAVDSMITPSMGNAALGHHHGQKVFALNGTQLFAFAGDQALAHRARYIVEQNPPLAATAHPLLHATHIHAVTSQHFGTTAINIANANVVTVVAFDFNNTHQCCAFGIGGGFQPMLLDAGNFFVALGSGKQFADPFLRFVADTFCSTGQPTVSEARFLATWVVQHVIETNPGGVAGPIRMAVLARNAQGQLEAIELPADNVQEHLEAVKEAGQVLRDWRAKGKAGQPPAPPAAPTPPPDPILAN